MKLENTLKVPEGQKLVIIKPQEILKTMERKKTQKNPTVLGVSQEQAQNLAMLQQGVVLQGVHQGGLQQIPIDTAHLTQDNTGLVRLAPKAVPATQGVQSVSLLQGVQKTNLSQHILAPKFASTGTVPPQKVQPSSPMLSSSVRLQTIAGKVSMASTVSKQATLQKATVVGTTGTVQPKSLAGNAIIPRETSHDIHSNSTILQPSQVVNSLSQALRNTSSIVTNQTPSKTSLITSQTGLAASAASSTATKTSLTTSQSELAAAGTRLTDPKTSSIASQADLPAQHSDQKRNLYQTIKNKLMEENSVQSSSNVKQSESLKQYGNAAGNLQSNAEEVQKKQIQSDIPVSKNDDQKIIVTYVSPDKPSKNVRGNVTTDKQTGAYIQVPSAVESRGSNISKNLKPTVTQASLQAANGQIPRLVPRIVLPVGQVKKEEGRRIAQTTVANSSSIPSTSNTNLDWPSIEEHESTLNNVVVRRRGRPRKNTSVDTTSEVPKQDSKKPLTGPTLKRELDRQGHFSGRAKTTKASEQQIKTVRHKRVSSTNPWTCALCGKVSFENSLGCLYGPYVGDGAKEGSDRGEEQDRKEGDEPQSKKKRSEDAEDELWFHGECLVWSPGVYALGESLAGYEQVVKDAQSRVRCH